jgi:cytochrome P450
MTAAGLHAPSLRDVRDRDPYPVYEALREHGPVVRDDSMGAWLVLDHAGCEFVERREDLFEEPTGSLPGAELITGHRDLRALRGEQHDALHRAISHAWRPSPLASSATGLVREVVAQRLAALSAAPRLELFSDLASLVPITVVARLLGLPDTDEPTIRGAKGWLEAVLAWRHTYGADPAIRDAAIEATGQLAPLLLPVIAARRERPDDDMISLIWEAGRTVADDWDAADVLANATFLFEGGSETTSLLVCTTVHLLLDEPAARRAVLLADDEAGRCYLEEILRHTTVVHWRARRATQDVELGGVTIRAGDMVHPVNAAANRDPSRWEDPARFDPTRPRLASHLAFNVGPRHCAGAHLARLQAREIVRALFAAFPDLERDPEAPAPIYAGYVSRAWRPLHLRHAPREPSAASAALAEGAWDSQRTVSAGRCDRRESGERRHA